MKGSLALMLVALVCFLVAAKTDLLREINLADGIRLQTQIVSLFQGVYTPHFESFSEIEIPAEKVRTISLAGTGDASSFVSSVRLESTPTANSAGSSMKLSLMQNPANVDIISSIKEDPLVQSHLNERQTKEAIKAGDIGTLLTNRHIRDLMNHPTI